MPLGSWLPWVDASVIRHLDLGCSVRVNGIDLHYTVEEGEGFPCLVPRPANTSVLERTFSARLRGCQIVCVSNPEGA